MNCIAFFCDAQILPGFHAALTSLLINHHSQTSLQIILFADRLSKKQKDSILKTFNIHKKLTQFFEIREAPEMNITGANSLKGNFTAYGRLFLSSLLPDKDLVLYLDSDIIVKCDVSDIFNKMNGDYALFVSGVGERIWSLDKDLYQLAGLEMDGLCFNSGIMGINLKKWRAQNGFEKCLQMIKKYPNQFLSADQSLLNLTFHDDFFVLNENYNIRAIFSDSILLKEGIYHFVGLPKPWGFGMKKYHKGYDLWYHYVQKSFLNFRSIKYFNISTLFKQRKSYFKVILFYMKEYFK